MRITEASGRLGISPRMLRYREALGLLPAVRAQAGGAQAVRARAGGARAGGARAGGARAGGARAGRARAGRAQAGATRVARAPGATGLHRKFDAADLEAVALGLAIEQRYDISPAELAFGLRVLTDPAARSQVAELGRRIGRIRPLPAMAMDFEKERALRLLGNPAGIRGSRAQPGRPGAGR